ncbi:hypothetical protein PL81_07255, partial [Streptomyces sp. RSD-27]
MGDAVAEAVGEGSGVEGPAVGVEPGGAGLVVATSLSAEGDGGVPAASVVNTSTAPSTSASPVAPSTFIDYP